MADSIGTLFFKDKQVKLLIVLNNQTREWHISDLSKEAGVTYLHTSNFIKKCEEKGLVASEKHGRTKRLVLTEKGREVAKGVSGLVEKIEQAEQARPAEQK